MSSILLIYTGGTIGMMENESGNLVPFEFASLQDNVPELRRFKYKIDSISFDQPIDSSDVSIAHWQHIAGIIEEHYEGYDGFVILHGTDTMSYSAAALSFMLENLGKPVIFTGSQLPIGQLRTDGKENLITAIEIAAAKQNGLPRVNEVCIYFQSQLFRGNRTHKYNTENFDAFESANLDSLADVGIHISYREELLLPRPAGKFSVRSTMDNNVAVLKIFPGISEQVVNAILDVPGLKAVVLETYGSGNSSRDQWFTNALKKAIQKGIIIMNVSQCNKGMVEQGRYETSTALKQNGVITGGDITTEAALAKLMFLLGNASPDIAQLLAIPLRGELSA